jgi:PIN domain nuclease of toxin-antitoxin system
VLLDTHVWIWGVEDEAGRLGRRTRRLLARPLRELDLRVSVVSVFEIAALHTASRLRLALAVDEWVRQALELPGVRMAELTPRIAIDAGRIPPTTLPDPFDRLLVATARHLGVGLLTRDRRILDYAEQTGQLRAVDAAA